MIVTVRTVPRDDGSVSVVLTRTPGDPRDPEVVHVAPTSRDAVVWMLDATHRIVASDRCNGYETRYKVSKVGDCSGFARLELEVAAGEELTIR